MMPPSITCSLPVIEPARGETQERDQISNLIGLGGSTSVEGSTVGIATCQRGPGIEIRGPGDGLPEETRSWNVSSVATSSPLVVYVGNRGDVKGSTPSVDRRCLRDPSPPTSGLSRYDSLVENHTRGIGGMHPMDNAVGHRARSSAGLPSRCWTAPWIS